MSCYRFWNTFSWLKKYNGCRYLNKTDNSMKASSYVSIKANCFQIMREMLSGNHSAGLIIRISDNMIKLLPSGMVFM